MKFVGIIGRPSSGKSTVIRSLTGCNSSIYQNFVVDKASKESIFVYCASPQEQTITLNQITQSMNACLHRPQCLGMVMAIQPTRPTRRVSMEQIYHLAQPMGFQCFAFVLDPGYGGNPPLFVNVRNRLTALNVALAKPNIVQLDGSRFAFRSAQDINRLAQLGL